MALTALQAIRWRLWVTQPGVVSCDQSPGGTRDMGRGGGSLGGLAQGSSGWKLCAGGQFRDGSSSQGGEGARPLRKNLLFISSLIQAPNLKKSPQAPPFLLPHAGKRLGRDLSSCLICSLKSSRFLHPKVGGRQRWETRRWKGDRGPGRR